MDNNSIQIDRYLQNEMSADERIAFEQQLATDKALQEELNVQQQILKAINNAGLKTEFGNALRKKILTRKLVKWGIVIAVAVIAIVLYTFKDNLFPHAHITESVVQEKLNEQFDINNAADTIIETKDGVVFAIPAHAFTTNNNTVQLQIKTALNAYDIMQSGLSTMSNDALLQTAGMFYINGFVDGKAVPLTKEIAVSVPAKNINPDMQLFDGVEDSSGNINWANPKPIDKGLRTYDITTLDFYPSKYIPALKALKKDYRNKNYTDSLYYSFSGYPHGERLVVNEEIVADAIYTGYNENQQTMDQQTTDSLQKDTHETSEAAPYQIDPSLIRAIWDKKFDNTILATKEFEERLRYMHTLCTSDFLEIYFRNLDKPLYVSDELCAAYFKRNEIRTDAKNRFPEFAARKDGAVMIPNGMQEKLSTYFQQKYTAYKEAAAKTWAKYQSALDSLNNIAGAKRFQQSINDFTRTNKNFNEELQINLVDAYRQIGVNYKDTPRIPPPTYYNVTITTTGWKNLDAYVLEATANRQSMTYTDPTSGKTATLTYNEVNIKIENIKQYDRVLVYLIPDSLSSFQKIQQQGDIFKERLNSLFKYEAIVLAYKGTQAYLFKQESLQAKEYSFSLLPVTDEAVRNALSNYSRDKNTALKNDFDYQLFEQQETIRQVQLQKDIEFREKIAASIFNCVEPANSAPALENVPIEDPMIKSK